MMAKTLSPATANMNITVEIVRTNPGLIFRVRHGAPLTVKVEAASFVVSENDRVQAAD